MKIIKASNSGVLISISNCELKVIKNVLNEVYTSISITEFSTRIGYSTEEFQAFIKVVNSALLDDFSIINVSTSEISLDLSNDNLYMLSQSFNEVCNGLHIFNFEEKIGMKEDELNLLFNSIVKWRDNQRSLG